MEVTAAEKRKTQQPALRFTKGSKVQRKYSPFCTFSQLYRGEKRSKRAFDTGTKSHLTGLGTLRVKLDLLGGQFSTRIHVVTQVDAAERALAQELPSPPRHGSAGRWRTTRPAAR